MTSPKKIARQIAIILMYCLLVFFSGGLVWAETCEDAHPAANSGGVSVKKFSDPSQQAKMPEEWIKKPLKYEKEFEKVDVSVVLDQNIYHVLLPAIEAFAKGKKLKIAAKESSCGIAASMLRNKSLDVGGFCCPLSDDDRLPGIRAHTLGIFSKVLLVHPSNPIENVSIEQARAIFSGKTIRWSELKTADGKPAPDWKIQSIGRFHCKNRPGHWYLILPDVKQFSPMLHEVGSIPDMIAQVGAHPEAIGWEELGMVYHYSYLGKVKPLKINGFSPTDKDALISRKYPLYRTYNLTTWEGTQVANPHADELIEYLRKAVEALDPKFGSVSASQLKAAGWKFKGDELVGEPD